ncbi:MAG: class I SAM-dependent methyltransferase [Rhodospirillaceae bacterium]|jgi:SAM-dependent methyltransferase|nr:class I SAM-dependent methyltransferase [Rhodospirillaceae bacterium]
MKFKKKLRRICDYWGWRLRHPGAPYEQYYVHRVLAKLKGGHGHPAIGPTARPLRSRSELLDFLLKYSVRPSDLVIDYGCGSLRLAPPLIAFLEPGKYWGMDLAQEFLDLGLSHLDPQLARDKRPRLDVIAPEVIERARAEGPRFIVSWHVCSKVPENRFDAYLGNIVRMMTPGSVALIHFPETEARRKLTGLAWAIPRSLFVETLPRLNPAVTCEFGAVVEGVVDGIRQSYAILRHP